jgi:hypothetical protein
MIKRSEIYFTLFVSSDYTQAKYQEVLKNSGLLHINGEVKKFVNLFFLNPVFF